MALEKPSFNTPESKENDAQWIERVAKKLQETEGYDYKTAVKVARLSLKSHKHEQEELEGDHRTEALERKDPHLR